MQRTHFTPHYTLYVTNKAHLSLICRTDEFVFCFLALVCFGLFLSSYVLIIQRPLGTMSCCPCKAQLDRPNDGSRSAGEGLLRITVFPFSRHNQIKWNTFSYIFYLVISSDSINEKVLMISVHH